MSMNIDVKSVTADAEAGNAEAQCTLGCYYLERNDAYNAIKWLTKSAEQGVRDAQTLLAQEYFFGKMVKQDIEKAAFWGGKAAEQGDDDGLWIVAQTHLAKLPKPVSSDNIHNDEDAKNAKTIGVIFKLLAEKGHLNSQFDYGFTLTRFGQVDEGIRWLKIAARNGHRGAQSVLHQNDIPF